MAGDLTVGDVIAALNRIADDLTNKAETLRELDAAIGDGDLGITVTIGFQAVREALDGLGESDLGGVLLRSGMAFNRKAASTFGALFATMMMRAARIVKGLVIVGPQHVADMLDAAAEGVRERGKADVGDKTLLDALVPAARAFRAAMEGGADLTAAARAAATAAESGARATIELKSKIGRASWFADRTQGIQDPGATAVYLMLKSFSEFLAEAGATT